MSLLILLAIEPLTARSQNSSPAVFTWSGHTKYQASFIDYSSDSYYYTANCGSAIVNNIDFRLVTRLQPSGGSPWDINLDYQLIGQQGEHVSLDDSQAGLFAVGLPNDSRRFFNLTDVLSESDNSAILQRLDRLNIGYVQGKTAVRVGRQALSWGNGLLFAPMDMFNPFDPTVFDKEYKTGDDMVYYQYLRDSGDDVQLVWVPRKDPLQRQLHAGQNSIALKYHTLTANSEIDILMAEHFDASVLGVGGNRGVGGAVVSGDLVFTHERRKTYTSMVMGLSYSLVKWNKNISLVAEYFHNGFGIDKPYTVDRILSDTPLLNRLQKGEIYTVGKNYLAMSASVELHPLLILTPLIFANLEDTSGLLQVVADYNWRQNVTLLFSLNLPLGPRGTEFGGLSSTIEEQYFSTETQLLGKISWYF